MFRQLLLKQTAGTKLKFTPESSMGFTSGENYVVVNIGAYSPSSTQVNLYFVEGPLAPSLSYQNTKYSTSFTSQVSSISPSLDQSVESAIEEAMATSSIDHLKSFNSGCNFQVVDFGPTVESI